MADLYAVKFRGEDLLSASEGEFRFKPGLRRRRITVQDLTEGAVIKDGCRGSATHVLTLQFATTSTNVNTIWANVYQRLQDMWDGVGGTLEVPDFPSFSNCTITNIELSEQMRVSTSTPEAGIVGGVTVEAVVTFEQT